MSLPSPVSRDAVHADLSSAPRERSRNTLVPAPFPTPSRGCVARVPHGRCAHRLESAGVERSGDRPVPAPFPTPRADPPRADSVAVPGDTAASEGITEALRELERAYQRRDVTLAKAVWPTVNERALARAFDGLRSQSVTFDRCTLEVSGAAGYVECRGVTTYVTRVGSPGPADGVPAVEVPHAEGRRQLVDRERGRALRVSVRTCSRRRTSAVTPIAGRGW